jgi:ComF family protein
VCAACWTRLRELPRPRCLRCATPRRPAIGAALAPEGCATCDVLPPAVRSLRSAYLLEGPAHRLVHGLKYGGWHCVAEPMGQRMAQVDLGEEAEEEVTLVVPVPLSAVRMRQRGYNQAELLAAVVARVRGLELRPELLERHRAGESQTALHPAERLANVAGAFRVPVEASAVLRRQHVMIVDDVWTTGATTLACASALRAGGARAVSVLTFARALPELRR